MPALFKKIIHPGGTKNPYSNSTHPNYNPMSSQNTPTDFNSQDHFPRPVSPRESGDLLAEAREAVGRDRVTGKKPVNPSTTSPQQITPSPNSKSSSGPLPENPFLGPGESSAAPDTHTGANPTSRIATRYNPFVQEMKERRAGGIGGVREPIGGYYAPAPREATEYYAPETWNGRLIRE